MSRGGGHWDSMRGRAGLWHLAGTLQGEQPRGLVRLCGGHPGLLVQAGWFRDIEESRSQEDILPLAQFDDYAILHGGLSKSR